jgi:hypothetical protein
MAPPQKSVADHIKDAAASSLVLATVSTVGDYLWANFLPHHRPIYGLTHGVLLFLCVGLCLGAASRKPATGAIGGALIGLLGAGAFYVLQPLMGYSAMFVLWFGIWIALGILNGRLSVARPATTEALIRGVLAAVGSGLAFYRISGIWFPFSPHGWDYAVHFLSWTIAYLPGFAALLLRGAARERTIEGQ